MQAGDERGHVAECAALKRRKLENQRSRLVRQARHRRFGELLESDLRIEEMRILSCAAATLIALRFIGRKRRPLD